MELVSAIITTHNRQPDMLMRAVSSVLAQSYNNMELIVVDDSDSGYKHRNEIRKEVLSLKYSRFSVHYVPHRDCRGLSAARNTGILASKGKYIAFLDDDDEWLPCKTTTQISVFHQNDNEIGLVYSPGFIMDDDSCDMKKLFCRYEHGWVYNRLLSGNWIGYPSFVMFRKSALMAVGGFDEKMTYMEDYDIYLRIASRYHINYSQEPVAIYHEHGSGQLTDDVKQYAAALKYILFKYHDDFEQNEYARQKLQQRLVEVGRNW